MDEVALEALVRIPKPCVPKLRAAEQCETLTGKNGSLSGKRNLLYMLERRKRASSAAVNEVGGQRVTLRHVSNRLFPNPPGHFHGKGLSREMAPPGIGLLRHPPHPLGSVHLPLDPFPVYRALPRSFEYYESSVTMPLSVCR